MSELILNTADDIVEYRTDIKGWVGKDKKYYGDGANSEEYARYENSTHRACKTCGEPADQNYTACETCREKHRVAKYYEMPEKSWDGHDMLYSEHLDEYLSSDALEDLIDDEHIQQHGDSTEVDDGLRDSYCDCLRLIICEKVYLSHLDEEYWADELVLEDGYHCELPDDVMAALTNLNDVITERRIKEKFIAWGPGDYRIKLDD